MPREIAGIHLRGVWWTEFQHEAAKLEILNGVGRNAAVSAFLVHAFRKSVNTFPAEKVFHYSNFARKAPEILFGAKLKIGNSPCFSPLDAPPKRLSQLGKRAPREAPSVISRGVWWAEFQHEAAKLETMG